MKETRKTYRIWGTRRRYGAIGKPERFTFILTPNDPNNIHAELFKQGWYDTFESVHITDKRQVQR